MKAGSNINGTGMSILVGVILVLAAFYTPGAFITKAGLFAFGVIMLILGLVFSSN